MNKSAGNWKPFALALAIAGVGYFACFNYIEYRRVSKGPWQVVFQNEGTNLTLGVSQASLNIQNVTLHFTNVVVLTNLSQTIRFEAGRGVPFEVPFGKCVFQDPLFLPGTVALEIAGHEIQLMPRTLTLDGIEHGWSSDQSFV